MLQKVKSFLFENTSVRQTVAKNTFWLTVSNIGGRLIRGIIIIYGARVLGADGWGSYSYAVTLVAFFSAFNEIGIGSILMREVASTTQQNERERIISTAFWIRMALLVISSVIVVFIAPHFAHIQNANRILMYATGILIFDTISGFGSNLIYAYERMEVQAAIYTLTNVVIVIAGFIALHLHPTAGAFTASYAIGTFAGALATVIVLRRELRSVTQGIVSRLAKKIFVAGWPFAITGLLGSLMVNTDVLLIGALLSATDVGLYSAPLRIIQLLYILPNIASVSILPTFSRLVKNDSAKFRSVFERTVGMTFLLAVPAAVGAFIIARSIIGFLFGAQYLAATLSFQILALTMIIDFPVNIFSTAVFAHDRQRSIIVYMIIGGVANIALDLVLIPRFGITGSAWATLIAQFVSNVYLWRVMGSIMPFSVLPKLGGILRASIVMGLVVWGADLVGLHVLGTIVLGIAAYFGFLVFQKDGLLAEALLVIRPLGKTTLAPGGTETPAN